jgi:hypothetical protein
MLAFLVVVLALTCAVLFTLLAASKEKMSLVENCLRNEAELKREIDRLNEKLAQAMCQAADRLDVLRERIPYIQHLITGISQKKIEGQLERSPKRLFELEKVWWGGAGWEQHKQEQEQERYWAKLRAKARKELVDLPSGLRASPSTIKENKELNAYLRKYVSEHPGYLRRNKKLAKALSE